MYLPPDLRILSALLGHTTNNGKHQPQLFRIALIDMRTYALQDFVLAFQNVVFVVFPVLFEIAAGLLVYLLFDVEVALVEDRDVVAENRDFDLWTVESVEGGAPSLDHDAGYHDVVTWFAEIDEVVFHYDDN